MQPAVPFTSRDLLPEPARDVARVVDALTGLSTLQRLYEDVIAHPAGVPFIDRALQTLSIAVEVSDDDLGRIPQAGPLIVAGQPPVRHRRRPRGGAGPAARADRSADSWHPTTCARSRN